MGSNAFNKQLENLLSTTGQFASVSKSPDIGGGSRIIYPAKVISIESENGMRRIKARILQVEADGLESPSKDKNVTDQELVTCVPLLPVYLQVMPRVGEMVIVFLESFGEGSTNATRYYIGPFRSTYFNYDYEEFKNAIRIKDPKQTNISVPNGAVDILPNQNEVALNGKKGAGLILSENRVRINVAPFINNTLNPNFETFGQIELNQIQDVKQYLNKQRIKGEQPPVQLPPAEQFTQINIRGNNINLIATGGNNKNVAQQGDIVIFTLSNEKSQQNKVKYDLEVLNNDNIFKLGKEAESLHPMVFGDELIQLLSKIIIRLETHIHTPQKPALNDDAGLRQNLLQYTIDSQGNINRLGDLISKLNRVN
jgi:predicted transcriptional regulator